MNKERRKFLKINGVLNSDWRQFISEKYCWHSLTLLDCLTGSELEGLQNPVAVDGFLGSFVNIVDLTDFEEIIDHQLATHDSMWWNELFLRNVSAIEFKIEFFVEVLFNVIYIFQLSKTQMIDLMAKIKSHAFLVDSLHSLWIMMSRNMEITWDFVDVHETTHFAPFVVFDLFFSLLEGSLRLIHSLLTFFMFIRIMHLGIDLSMSIFVDVGEHSQFISVLIQSMFV